MKSWIRIISISIFFSIMISGNVIYAADTISQNEWEEYDFEEVNEALDELFPNEKLDFKETVVKLISGEMKLTSDLLNQLVKERISYAFSVCKDNLVHILLIAVFAAVFTNFSNVFQNKQISDVSFYILYLLLIALCLNSVQAVAEWIGEGIQGIVNFMSAFCPLYFLAVGMAKGSITAVAFYNLVLILITIVEFLILKLLIPGLHIFVMVKILNYLSEEEYLSKFADLIEIIFSWTLKTLTACVVGLNLVQGLINPAIDTVKQSAVTRSAEAIPGIGDALGGTAEVVLGTAVLIKNGIGLTGAIFCFALCVVPLIQTGVIVLIYKLAAAVIQPVSDKRIIGCIECVSDGCRLMMKLIFTTALLFLITIVIVTTLTGL